MKVGILISGRGSNMQALIGACKAGTMPVEIALVVSNRADAGGLALAEAADIPTKVIRHKDYDSREAFDDALHESLTGAGVELVCLAGFMRLLTKGFVDRWHDRLVNIHPSLLPAFKGLDVHERVLAAGVRITGCTVHFIRAEMDTGPVIVQAAVPVAGDDTPDTLAARVLAQEHVIYPLALRLIAEGRVQVVDERTVISGPVDLGAPLVNPAA
jgi:phosphoribosylglycinamide formyltransferase-1